MQQGAIIRLATLRHDTTKLPARALTRPARAQGRQAVRPCGLASEGCHDTNGCIVTGGAGPVLRQTLHHARHDAQYTHGVRTAWKQCVLLLGQGAHCTLEPVLTQCIVYSNCLDHYSWSLFMNTVQEVLKKIYI